MKKMKKLTALLLTLVMSLALAVPCFAAEPEENPRENAICLKEGDSVTINGITATLKRVDEAENLDAVRANRHYLARNIRWRQANPYERDYICYKSYGDTLVIDLANDGDAVEMYLWLFRHDDLLDDLMYYFDADRQSNYRLELTNYFSSLGTVTVEWSVMQLDDYPMDFLFNAYQE